MANPSPVTGAAFRGALACVLCLAVVEFWRLPHANLAVWTTHMVTAQYSFTAFQKGMERVIGRGVGILLGLAILTGFRNAPFVAEGLKLLALTGFFYIHFSGRLAYTFLNAGLYLAVIMAIGEANPSAARTQGWDLFVAVVVGVILADLTMWATGAEKELEITTTGQPLLPIDSGRFGQSLQLVATVAATQLIVGLLQLPTSASIVSVMVLTIAPDLQSLILKGELRLLGALLGSGWALVSFVILNRLPHFLILEGLLFLGIAIAIAITRASTTYSYAGLQMGLVLPMVLISPVGDHGDLKAGVVRIVGIVVAVLVSVFVGAVWTAVPHQRK